MAGTFGAAGAALALWDAGCLAQLTIPRESHIDDAMVCFEVVTLTY